MAEGVNVRFVGELQRFVHRRVGDSGLYGSASEYIRDLVRRDYEREEQRKWAWLRSELKRGLEADETEFTAIDANKIIAEAKARRKKTWRLKFFQPRGIESSKFGTTRKRPGGKIRPTSMCEG